MTGVSISTPAARAGAGLIVAQAGHLLVGGPDVLDDAIRGDGRLDTLEGPIHAVSVAAGSAALVAKILGDVEAAMGISYGRTLSNLGLWVAREEIRHGV